jgi:hypothetical protein
MTTAADRRWFAAVASLETCALCGSQGEQVAHRDYGKGMGLKTKAHMTAYLCGQCHRELTDGKEYDRAQKRAFMDHAIVETHSRLIDAGQLVLKVK